MKHRRDIQQSLYTQLQRRSFTNPFGWHLRRRTVLNDTWVSPTLERGLAVGPGFFFFNDVTDIIFPLFFCRNLDRQLLYDIMGGRVVVPFNKGAAPGTPMYVARRVKETKKGGFAL
jgi:hypothetical protein